MKLRLGSFNLLSGRSLTDGTIDSERLVESVGELDADLLAVQEVDRFQPRSGRIDQTALIAKTLGALDLRFVPTVTGTPGEPGWTEAGASTPRPAGPPSELAQFGVALVSRLPVAEWHVLRLSPARGRFRLLTADSVGDWREVVAQVDALFLSEDELEVGSRDEPRAAVAAVLERPRITIACTHLSFAPLVNVRQLLTVRRWLARLPGPQLLIGDLNLPGRAVRRITGWTPLVSAPTFPSPGPWVQLDHALAAGLPPGARASGRVHRRLPISDHRAVVVDLELPEDGGGIG